MLAKKIINDSIKIWLHIILAPSCKCTDAWLMDIFNLYPDLSCLQGVEVYKQDGVLAHT